jgi:hypothetical protein
MVIRLLDLVAENRRSDEEIEA